MFLKFKKDDGGFCGRYDDSTIKKQLTEYLKNSLPLDRKISIICVGSDRSTGDSLGPLVGTFLSQDKDFKKANVEIFGTLEEPIHAKNINKVIKKIQKSNDDTFVLIVDACLDSHESVGSIRAQQKPLECTKSIAKGLSSIGDFNVHMVVNVGGFLEYKVLQNTKLSLVLKGADIIADAIAESISILKK